MEAMMGAAAGGDTRANVDCTFFMRGYCANGALCPFKHDEAKRLRIELERKQALLAKASALTQRDCTYFLRGNCLRGDACMFRHDPAKLLKPSLNAPLPSTAPEDAAPFVPRAAPPTAAAPPAAPAPKPAPSPKAQPQPLARHAPPAAAAAAPARSGSPTDRQGRSLGGKRKAAAAPAAAAAPEPEPGSRLPPRLAHRLGGRVPADDDGAAAGGSGGRRGGVFSRLGGKADAPRERDDEHAHEAYERAHERGDAGRAREQGHGRERGREREQEPRGPKKPRTAAALAGLPRMMAAAITQAVAPEEPVRGGSHVQHHPPGRVSRGDRGGGRELEPQQGGDGQLERGQSRRGDARRQGGRNEEPARGGSRAADGDSGGRRRLPDRPLGAVDGDSGGRRRLPDRPLGAGSGTSTRARKDAPAPAVPDAEAAAGPKRLPDRPLGDGGRRGARGGGARGGGAAGGGADAGGGEAPKPVAFSAPKSREQLRKERGAPGHAAPAAPQDDDTAARPAQQQQPPPDNVADAETEAEQAAFEEGEVGEELLDDEAGLELEEEDELGDLGDADAGALDDDEYDFEL